VPLNFEFRNSSHKKKIEIPKEFLAGTTAVLWRAPRSKVAFSNLVVVIGQAQAEAGRRR
jgi:hypothetical protein